MGSGRFSLSIFWVPKPPAGLGPTSNYPTAHAARYYRPKNNTFVVCCSPVHSNSPIVRRDLQCLSVACSSPLRVCLRSEAVPGRYSKGTPPSRASSPFHSITPGIKNSIKRLIIKKNYISHIILSESVSLSPHTWHCTGNEGKYPEIIHSVSGLVYRAN